MLFSVRPTLLLERKGAGGKAFTLVDMTSNTNGAPTLFPQTSATRDVAASPGATPRGLDGETWSLKTPLGPSGTSQHLRVGRVLRCHLIQLLSQRRTPPYIPLVCRRNFPEIGLYAETRGIVRNSPSLTLSPTSL